MILHEANDEVSKFPDDGICVVSYDVDGEVVEGKVDDTLSVMADEVAEVAEKNNVNW